MMVKVEMSEAEIREALAKHLTEKCGLPIDPKGLDIEVKSKQNYRSEWEHASIRLNSTLVSQ
jgi:hypothetical protein